MKARYLLMMGLAALATACSQDEAAEDQSQSDGILQVETTDMGTRVAAFSNLWANYDQISLSLYNEGTTTDYLSNYSNYFRFTYSGGKWSPASQWKLNSKWATVYAVYPAQSSSLANGVYVSATSQQEYLYATSRVTSKYPTAQLTFHPALAQVNVYMGVDPDSTYRTGYNYYTTEVALVNKTGAQAVASSATMTFPNGQMTNLSYGTVSKSIYTKDSVYVSMLAIPNSTKGAQLRFRVNNKYAYVDLPETGQWEQGKIYTYWVSLHATLPDDIYLTLDRTAVSINPRTSGGDATDLEVDANVK